MKGFVLERATLEALKVRLIRALAEEKVNGSRHRGRYITTGNDSA